MNDISVYITKRQSLVTAGLLLLRPSFLVGYRGGGFLFSSFFSLSTVFPTNLTTLNSSTGPAVFLPIRAVKPRAFKKEGMWSENDFIVLYPFSNMWFFTDKEIDNPMQCLFHLKWRISLSLELILWSPLPRKSLFKIQFPIHAAHVHHLALVKEPSGLMLSLMKYDFQRRLAPIVCFI